MYNNNICYGRLLGVLMLSFFMAACGNDEAPTPIDLISEIIISDNSNNGNGSDIEVNFSKQLSTNQIKEYRIFAIKATKAAGFSIEQANSIDPERYTSVAPDDIYKIKGRVLEAETNSNPQKSSKSCQKNNLCSNKYKKSVGSGICKSPSLFLP